MTIFDKFRLDNEKEDHEKVIASIGTGIVFKGTNLWVLILAIFVASLGLNVNSTAVIIGAMLISPLMGPIMGIGLGMGINDVSLLRKALTNYLVATFVALITSTIFFLISPLGDAHSEILARTSPNIYDVLIAVFGGLAGILATSSKNKGNVITGVAIATALMPPLCTAGYGLATLQFSFFFGAFYLYIINTVFIALATFTVIRLLRFPLKDFHNEASDKRSKQIVMAVALVTLLPSLYFGYDIVEQSKFTNTVNRFINNEAHFTNDYLLSKKIDAKERTALLVFGGKEISQTEISNVKSKLKAYDLDTSVLQIRQGFAYLSEANNNGQNDQTNQLNMALNEREQQLKALQKKADSVNGLQQISWQVYAELKAQYPQLKSAVIQPATILKDSLKQQPAYLVILNLPRKLTAAEQNKLSNQLKIRLKQDTVSLIVQ